MKNLEFLGFKDYCVDKSGKVYSLKSNRFLKPQQQRTGYYTVSLRNDTEVKTVSLHRVVALAFIENPEGKPQVNHINGDKSDNSVCNLEWMTPKENVQHAYDTGLARGTRNPDRFLSDDVAHGVCILIQDSWRNKDIAESFGIPQQIVADIRWGKSYQEISCEYDFGNTLPSRRKIEIPKLIRICELLSENDPKNTLKAISEEVGCSMMTVRAVKMRKSGIYISCNYNF